MKTAIRLTDDQVRTIRGLWATGESQSAIAVAAGISMDTLKARLRDQITDLPARDRRANSGRRGVDPSPAEIIHATALIRETWDESRWLPEPAADFEIPEN